MDVNEVMGKLNEMDWDIKFKDDKHKSFFGENVIKTKSYKDTYRKAFFYTLGISPETRAHINSLYDFKDNCPKAEGLNAAWHTSGTQKLCCLAFNLYNGFHHHGETWESLEADTDGAYTPYELFGTPDAFYMLEAVKIRYPEYTKERAEQKTKQSRFYRYYSTQRPFGLGTYPRRGGTENVVNFDGKIYCEEIGKEAWGYITYKEPISSEEISEYELTSGGTDGRVLVGINSNGKTTAFVM